MEEPGQKNRWRHSCGFGSCPDSNVLTHTDFHFFKLYNNQMKLRVCLTILFLSLAGSICCAQPSIQFKQTEHDFGDVADEDKVVHVFEFTNDGDKELEIEKTIAS